MTAIAHKPLQSKNLKRAKRVLVVEDERDLAELLAYNLSRAGYETIAVQDGRSGLEAVNRERPDLIILDLMLPELSGMEVASKIRTNPSTASIPIIMLTAKTDEVDQVVGLTLGADDYVTKPFSFKVLQARIEAVLRRAAETTSTGSMLRVGPLAVNLETHEAMIAGKPMHLTLTEFRILAALMQAGGRVLSRHHLMSKAMGPGITVTERTIDVHVTSIRKKLGDHAELVRTVRGVGYRATPEPELAEA